MKNVEDIYPLSPLQKGMLFHSLMAPESGVYVSQVTCTLPADLDLRRFRQAWETLVARHGALRTAFLWDGLDEPLQVVRKSVSLPWQELDWSGLSAEERQSGIEELRRRDRHTPLPLSKAPLLRFSLVRLRRETGFLWTFHHLLLDGWSLPLLMRELAALYAALQEDRPPALPPVRPFSDYIVWLRKRNLSQAEPFWRRELAGFAAPTPLGIDHPAGAAGASDHAEHERHVPREVTAGLQALAARHKLTLQSVTLGAWALLLHRYSSEPDVVFGCVVSGRPATLPGVETMVGLFINTLPARVRVSDAEPLAPWLQLLQERQLARQDFEHTPLLEIQCWSEVPSGSPLFETLYAFENYPVVAEDGGSGGLRTDNLRISETTNYPLTLILRGGDQIPLRLVYDRARIEEAAAQRLLRHLATLLSGMAEGGERRLSDLGLLTAEEALQLRVRSETTVDPPDRPLHAWIEERAGRSPGHVAVTSEGEELAYGELDRRANRLAQHLRALGVGPEARVAVLLERSAELVVALLAVLKAGGAYVPLDSAYPAERIAFLLADSAASVLVTEGDLAAALPPSPVRVVRIDADRERIAALPAERLAGPMEPAHLAYIIYTSGSTGRPKGVQVTHANVLRLFSATEERFGFGPADVWPFFHSAAFDFSVWEIWGALLHGGRLVVVPYEVSRSPGLFHDLLTREKVTVLNQTPSAFSQLAQVDEERGGAATDLRLVIFGGEALDLAGLAPWFARHGDERPLLVNMYGITETTVHVTVRPLCAADARETRSLIGIPLPDLSLTVMDPGLRPVPLGAPGELAVGGAGLARGYLGRPELTAERFVPDPLGKIPGARLYRSGDLGRLLPEGEVEYLGRIDHQVKIRGFRIELGEIEALLAALPGVREAVVVAREGRSEGGTGDRRLVAYVAGDATADALRRSLRERLPEYMVPAAFVSLPALPLTVNGKVDRKALPAPERQGDEESYLAPRAPVEEILAGIWAGLLGLERVGAADHFFELGGHSLLAAQVMSRLRSTLGVTMPLRDLFEAPVLADLAARVEKARRADVDRPTPPLVPVPREAPLPLSFAQQRLWFIDQLEPGRALYNMPAVLRVKGALRPDVAALCLGEIVRRHEALRTVFVAQEGSPAQRILPAAPFELPVVDLSGLPDRREAFALAGEEAARGFDLACGPLLRGRLLRLGESDHILALTLHHIASDGWSMGILVREVAALYAAFAEGRPSPLPELPVQYADFAVWQRSWLQGEVLEGEISFWRRQLAALPPLLELPTDRTRPAAQSFRGASRPVRLPAGLIQQIEALSRREGVTLFMVLLAGFQALLARSSGQRDLAVGTPVAGRNQVEVEGLIGLFVNTLPLRLRTDGDPGFVELLARVRAASLDAHAHQDLPFERLVEELQAARSLAWHPVFQVAFTLQNVPFGELLLPGLALEPLDLGNGVARLDLLLSLGAAEEGLTGSWEYSTDLFDATTVERMTGHLETLLAAAAADPARTLSDLPLLTAAESFQLLVEWNDTRRPASEDLCLQDLFAANAERRPEALAVVDEGRSLTYGELARRAALLADHLRALGVGPEALVGICLDEGLERFVAVLGVFLAGGAYLPLDPTHPRERLAFMIEDTAARVVLTQAGLVGALPGTVEAVLVESLPGEGAAAGHRPGKMSAHHLAYVIYTSGSTGRPNGVMVTHRSAVNLILQAVEQFRVTPSSRVLQSVSFSFDPSILETWMAFAAGATLCVARRETRMSGEALAETLRRMEITTAVMAVPAVLAALPPEENLPLLRVMGVGGDLFPAELARRWAPPSSGLERLLNCYGPTEAAIYAAAADLRASNRREPPIGRPVANTRAYLLDPHGRPVPAGVPGELHLAGAGLARGYLDRPALTAERFVPDPFGPTGSRLYRTGDLARRRQEGDLEFLGRLDHQVKIRGFRIELGEIEAAILALPGVREAAVMARDDRSGAGPGDRRLVAYVAGDVSADALHQALRSRLPDYMVPAAFVRLAALPLTPTGKVDRKALPAPQWRRAEGGHVAPRTPVEEVLAGIWSELLGLDQVGAEDRFFDLGGHSLLATQVMSRLRSAFRVEMPLRDLFEAPTLAGLAARVEAARRAGADRPALPLAPVPRTGDFPLSFTQERLWFLDQLEPGSPAYNMASAVELTGTLDVAALSAALGGVAGRHEVLRTVFPPVDGEPRQRVLPALAVRLPVLDLAGLPPALRLAEAQRLAVEHSRYRFDLTRGPLLDAALLRLDPGRHRLLVVLHHAICDGWSLTLLVREVGALYTALTQGQPSPLAELPVQYADFSVWQRSTVAASRQSELAFWMDRLGGDILPLELPTDRPRPAVQTYRGGQRGRSLSPALAARLVAFGRSQGATLFMVLLAAIKPLLHRHSGQEDILVGAPVAGRRAVETENLIGCFLNTLVLRTDLGGAPSFHDLVARLREVTLGAYSHQDVPIEAILARLPQPRDLSRTPLFQVMVNLLNIPSVDMRLPGLTLESLPAATLLSKFDMTFYVSERDGGVRIELVYNADLFDTERMEDVLAQLETLLDQALERPGEPIGALSLLTRAARAVLPNPAAELPAVWTGFVHERFAAQARRHTERTAVTDRDGAWSYGDLESAANRLGHWLRAQGVREGDRVAVYAHRSAPLALALLGTLKAGAAFTVLDPAYPAARLAAVLATASPRALLRLEAAGDFPAAVEDWLRVTGCPRLALPRGGGAPALELLAGLPDRAPEVSIGPDDPACLTFTSGSTGVPKGVLASHLPISHFIAWHSDRFGLAATDRFSLLSGLAHDPLLRDLLTPLCLGAVLAVPAPEELVPGRLAGWMRREGITVAHLTPALCEVLTEIREVPLEALRFAFFGGDVLTRRTVERLRALAPGGACVNYYGATETPQGMGVHEVAPADRERIPLGRGVDGVQLLVLNDAGGLAGVGELGEICVRTPYLSLGYLDDEALTRERFASNPFTGAPGDRLYRTGDLGRYLPDGAVEIAGRRDAQVKIRGFRIEPGEIERALRGLDGVREAVVVAREERADGGAGDRRLVAYVVGDVVADALRRSLRERLPDYLVPAAFVVLEALPLTPNGKVDRKALPAPEWQGADEGYLAPRTQVEEALAAIWAELLGVERVGAEDRFFDLGGHSILATRAVSRIRAAFGVEVPLRTLFENRTLAELAAQIGQEGGEASAVPVPPLVPAPRAGDLPLSFAQQRLLFLHMLAPEDVSYNMPIGLRLSGPMEPPRLEGALRRLVARHEVLRTAFAFADGQPVQRIAGAGAVALPLLDLSGLPAAPAEWEASRLAGDEVRRPFDLLQGPVLRAALLRLQPEEHMLAGAIHHIAMDGWSWGVFYRELVELYEKGEAAELPALPVQYADYAVWQRSWLQGEALKAQLEYWRERLAGLAPRELPADRPRPPARSGRGAALPLTIPGSLAEAVRDLARQEDATLFMALLSAFAVLMHRHTESDRLILGTDIANRRQAELDGLLGLFVNQLALSFDLSGNPTFRQILRQVRRDTLEAYMHQDAPFDRLIELLRPDRDVSRTPLFQLKLVLQNTPFAVQSLRELTVAPIDVPRQTAKFDLLLNLMETGDGIAGHAEYSTDLFEAATIARFLDGFVRVLRSVAERPDAPLDEIEAEIARLETREQERQDQERWSLSLARGRRRVLVDQTVS